MSVQFVGRDKELSRLGQLLQKSLKGNGRFVALAGEAGIGKTRLMVELARLASDRGSYVIWSQMIEDPFAPPYTAWLLALRAYVQQVDDDTLRADMGSGAVHIADIVPELRERLGLSGTRPPSDSEAAARFQLYDSVTRLLLTLAKRQPLVLLFDNLHLADQSSLLLLEYYVRQLTGSASLIIAAHRDGGSADQSFRRQLAKLAGTASPEELRLTGLALAEVGELMRSTLGAPPSPGLVEIVYARGDGNPLFTYQVATNLARQSKPSAELRTLGPFQIPDSLVEVIDARLAALDSNVLRMLRIAAVLGRDFETRLLTQLCDSKAISVSGLIEQAIDAGIVIDIEPERCRFEHALFREALYGQLSTQERRDLHLLVARKLTTKFSDSAAAAAPATELAYHWVEASRGSYYSEAVEWCQRAADAASARRGYGEAAIHLEHALAMADLEDPPDTRLRYILFAALGEAQYLSGQPALADRTWLKAALLAHSERWPNRLAKAVIRWQYIRAQTGLAHLSGVPLHEAALKLLPREARAMRTRLLASQSIAFRHRGNNQRARRALIESVEVARMSDDQQVLYECLIKAFYVLDRAYDAPQRLRLIDEAVAIAINIGREEDLLIAITAQLFTLGCLGRIDEIRSGLDDFSARADRAGHYFFRQLSAGIRVELAILDARWTDALSGAIESVSQGSLLSMPGMEGRFGFQMFSIHRALGTLDRFAPLFAKLQAANSKDRTWLPGRALLHCELEQRQEALAALRSIGDLRELGRDDLYETTLVYLTDAAVWLKDRARCRELFELLQPFRGYNLTLPGIVSHGATSGYLAILAVALRRIADARKLFDEALQSNESMGAWVHLTRVRIEYAKLLLGSDATSDHALAQGLLAQARATINESSLGGLKRQIEFVTAATALQSSLSARELEVLALIAAGGSNKAIAASLHISLTTVATHIRNILRKTATRNRTEAVAYARQYHLLARD